MAWPSFKVPLLYRVFKFWLPHRPGMTTLRTNQGYCVCTRYPYFAQSPVTVPAYFASVTGAANFVVFQCADFRIVVHLPDFHAILPDFHAILPDFHAILPDFPAITRSSVVPLSVRHQ